MFSKLLKYIPTVQQIAVSAFTVLCLVLTLFVSILCSDLVQTGAVTLNIRYLPSRNEVTEYVSAPATSYYYTPSPPVAPIPPSLPDGFIYPPENPDTKDLEFDWSPPAPEKEGGTKAPHKKTAKKGDGSI